MRYALPNKESYPIETMSDAVKAEGYFLQHELDFDVLDRREYCKNLEKRQQELGLNTHTKVAHYAGTKTSTEKLASVISSRAILLDKEASSMEELRDIVGNSKNVDEMLARLTQFDKKKLLAKYWDNHMPNPVLGLVKDPRDDTGTMFYYNNGDHPVSKRQIEKLVFKRNMLRQAFSDDWIDLFCKDPCGVFQKLPDHEKTIIARLAWDETP